MFSAKSCLLIFAPLVLAGSFAKAAPVRNSVGTRRATTGTPPALTVKPALSSPRPASPAAKATATPVPFDFALDERPFIEANDIVEIEDYDPKAKMYHLKRPRFPDANFLYVTLESLAASVESIDRERLKKRPEKIVGSQFSTDRDLLILTVKEVQARRARH